MDADDGEQTELIRGKRRGKFITTHSQVNIPAYREGPRITQISQMITRIEFSLGKTSTW